MTLKNLLKFFLRFFRNLSIKIPIIYNIFLKLEHKRAPNTEFFSSKSRNINNSILYAQNKFSHYLDLIRKSDENFKLKNKRILEIGPGDNLLIAFIFLLNGAKEVYLIDKFHKPLDDLYDLDLLKHYLKTFSYLYSDYTLKNIDSLKNRIKYFPNTPFENFDKLNRNTIDLILSNAVLEHLLDVETAIKMMKFLLKDSGLSIHHIDLRDHLHLLDKCFLDFLKFSPRFWKYFGDLTNRMRYSQYIFLFKKYKFDIIYTDLKRRGLISRINEIKNNFHHNYKILSNEDLSITSFDLIAKK